jgi:hypothetical protein
MRMNRRAIALLAVFAIALSGTGLASLAVLTDNVSVTVNGSITTIDLRANGTKSATIDLATGSIPGDLRFASIHLTNSGTGYVKLPTGTSIQSGAGQLTSDSRVEVWASVAPAQCNDAGFTGTPFGTASTPRLLTDALWDGEPQIDAGGFRDYCLRYRLGTANSTYADGISAFSLLYAISGYYP